MATTTSTETKSIASAESEDEPRRLDYSHYNVVEQRQSKPQQRLVLFLHWIFKAMAFFIYVFSGKGNLLNLGYVSTFVFVVLLLSLDFWVVKNLSGRLLAGLRWWSSTDTPSGQMIWRFEAWTPEERQIAFKSQINLFWSGLFCQQTLWCILFLSALFGLHFAWIIITIIACVLNGANLYGYIRCRLQQPSEFQKSLLARLRDGVVSVFRFSNSGKGVNRSEYSRAEVVESF